MTSRKQREPKANKRFILLSSVHVPFTMPSRYAKPSRICLPVKRWWQAAEGELFTCSLYLLNFTSLDIIICAL